MFENSYSKLRARSVNPSMKFEILSKANWKCHYCQNPISEITSHIDHAIPRVKGGLTIFSNLRASCISCNLEKGEKTELEYLLWKIIRSKI